MSQKLCLGIVVWIGLAWISLADSAAYAQQTVISSPFNRASSSFYENIGVNWGFNIAGGNPGGSSFIMGFNNAGPIGINQGGAGVVPPFGNFDPNSAARLGFATRGNGGSGFFNITAGQGSNRSIISQTPSVVVPNGGTGAFYDVNIRPFVTAVVPVVGNAQNVVPFAPAPRRQSVLAQRVARLKAEGAPKTAGKEAAAAAMKDDAPLRLGAGKSTAEQGDLSVAEIRRRRAAGVAQVSAEEQHEIELLIERGRGAEQAGKDNVARIYYQQAARRAEGQLKQQLLKKIESIGGK